MCRKDRKTRGLVTFSTARPRFLARRLGHLLVNPERLEKDYKGTVGGHGAGCAKRERGRASWKSPRRVITPRLLITHRVLPTGLFSRSLVLRLHRLVLVLHSSTSSSSSFMEPSSPYPLPLFPSAIFARSRRRATVRAIMRASRDSLGMHLAPATSDLSRTVTTCVEIGMPARRESDVTTLTVRLIGGNTTPGFALSLRWKFAGWEKEREREGDERDGTTKTATFTSRKRAFNFSYL